MAFSDKYQPSLPSKKTIARSQEKIVSAYNYVDVVEGSGLVDFYLGTTNETGGVDWIMETETFRTYATSSGESTSHSCYVGASRVAGTHDAVDFDFDSKVYNKQVTLYGTALVNFTMKYFDEHVRVTASTGYPVVYLRRYNATEGEVEIASVTGETVTLPTAGILTREYSLRISVPKTLIKIGDIIRVTINLKLIVNDSDATEYAALGLAYSPTDEETTYSINLGSGVRDFTWAAGDSQTSIKIPYLVQD